MNCIDEQFRLKIKSDIEFGKTLRKQTPIDINNGKAVVAFIKRQDYCSQLYDILQNNKNFQSIGYLVKCIVNNLDLLSCDTCGKELTYDQSFKSNGKFGRHCSVRCAQLDPRLIVHIQNKVSAYYMANFGVTNAMQLSSTVAKAKQTFTEHYGVDNNMKSEKGMQEYRDSMQERYGVNYTWELSSVQEKRKISCLSSLGVEFPLQSNEIIDKAVQTKFRENDGKYFSDAAVSSRINTFIKHYGVDNNMKSEKGMQEYRDSMQERYGVDYPAQCLSIHEKIKQTTFNNFGVYYPAQSHEIFLKIIKKYFYDKKWFHSKPELAFYIWLTDNNIEFEYQPNFCFNYEYNGVKYKYFPDFKIGEKIIEIKGNHFLKKDGTWQCPYDHSKDELFEEKRKCCIKNNVIIMYKQDYLKYIKYVENKYG